jgi:hypothetical protein
VAEYELVQALPERLETSLPSIEQIEHELEVPPAVTAAQGGRRGIDDTPGAASAERATSPAVTRRKRR